MILANFNYVSLFHSNRESYESDTSTPDHNHLRICNNIRNQINVKFSFFFTCIKITQYLIHINNENAYKDPTGKCEFLNYLINSKINDIKLGGDSNSKIFDDIISEFTKKLNSEIKICLPSMKHIKKEELIDLKILMDLFGNFAKFMKINEEKDVDCSLGEECVKSYIGSLDKCKDNNNIKFCNILEVFNEYYNEQAPNLDNCKTVQRYLPPVKGYINAVSHGVTAVFTVSIISSTIYLIYKFTPLQSWIRPQIVEKKKLLKNLQEETFKLQENYKINESGTRNNGFNLAYNAVHN